MVPILKMRRFSCLLRLSLPPEMGEMAQTFISEIEWLAVSGVLVPRRGYARLGSFICCLSAHRHLFISCVRIKLEIIMIVDQIYSTHMIEDQI